MTLTLVLIIGCGVAPVAARSDGTGVLDVPTEPPAFAIAPSGEVEGAYFSATIEPGSQRSMTAALVNAGETAFTARTFVADAYTTVNGGMGVKDDGSEPTGVTTWVDYPAETLTLAPRGTVEREFSVSVPADTAPGQYITGIVLQTADPLPVSGSTTFTQLFRKSVAVFITVPGPIQPGLTVGAVSLVPGEAWSALTVEVANTGNVLIRPTGAVVLSDAVGAPVLSAPVAMGAVYAGHATAIEIVIQDPLPPGDYTIDVDLTDEEHALTASSREPITVAPPVAPAPPPLAIGAVALDPKPSPEEIQYVEVGVRIANTGEPIGNARLVLHVSRDGEAVEDFPLASSLGLPTGATEVKQRYIPAGGWAAGTYTFALTLETVDPGNGVARMIAAAEIDATVAVP